MRKDIKKLAIQRLRRAAGQIRGLENLVEAEAYCVKILHQSMAAKEALSSFEDFILKNHLETHVREQMKSGKARRAVEEMLSVYRLAKKK